jgi:hypothetical protein
VLKAPNNLVPLDDPKIPYDRGLVSSPKKDGNRGLCIRGELKTSSLGSPRNRLLYDFMNPLIELAQRKGLVFDYELYDPNATHHSALSGIINSYNQPLPDQLGCFVFDAAPYDDFIGQCVELPFSERYHIYQNELADLTIPECFVALEQRPVNDPEEASTFYEADLEAGDEGSILRALHIDQLTNGKLVGGWYKFGRATYNQAIIWKFKNFETMDGIIIGVQQRRKLKDGLIRTRSASGHLERPHSKDAYELTDAVGAFDVRYLDDSGQPQTTQVGFGKGFTLTYREEYWQRHLADPNSLIGHWIEFKHMPHGAKSGGRARFGQLLRFREDLDL